MNYIRHLNAFFFKYVKRDRRLSANHVSLYIALFQYWNYNRFQNPFAVSRDDVMGISGIGSKNTYHKCLKELHQYGYIFYVPSLNKFHKSKVHIIKLAEPKEEGPLKQLDLFDTKNDTHTEPKSVQQNETIGTKIDTDTVSNLTDTSPKNDTDTVPNLGLLIKHKQVNNKQERETLTQKIFDKNQGIQKNVNVLGGVPKSLQGIEPPSLPEVEIFFEQNNYPIPEANKFFNHYKSNGWLVGGKTPMQDWKSSAHKWMLNTSNFKTHNNGNAGKQQSQNNNSETGKDYSEPL